MKKDTKDIPEWTDVIGKVNPISFGTQKFSHEGKEFFYTRKFLFFRQYHVIMNSERVIIRIRPFFSDKFKVRTNPDGSTEIKWLIEDLEND